MLFWHDHMECKNFVVSLRGTPLLVPVIGCSAPTSKNPDKLRYLLFNQLVHAFLRLRCAQNIPYQSLRPIEVGYVLGRRRRRSNTLWVWRMLFWHGHVECKKYQLYCTLFWMRIHCESASWSCFCCRSAKTEARTERSEMLGCDFSSSSLLFST